ARVAHEDRRGHRVLARVLEDDARVLALAQDLPQRGAETAGTLQPLAVGLVVLPVRHHAPVPELLAVDAALGAEALAELDVRVARAHRNRNAAERAHDLDRLAAEAAGAAPHQHHVARLDGVRRPRGQHAVGGGTDQHVGRGRLPGEMLRLGQALVRLRAGELREAAEAGLVAPDAEAPAEHRIAAPLHDRIVRAPHAAVDDDLVADLHVPDRAAHLPDDPGGVAAADVEAGGVGKVGILRPRLGHVDRYAERRPYVVVVDAGGHHPDEHLVGLELGGN